MKYCKRCLYPEIHPLGLMFDDKGVCSGCRVHEEKDSIDWQQRLALAKQIASIYRRKTRTIHDCVVPVSGGRDSFFIVHLVKNVLGLHPLLVSYNKQYNTQTGIHNLSRLRTLLGCDFISSTVSPERAKRITKETLRLRGSIYWHCLAGQTAFPVQIAVKFKIPLVIWGAHQGVDQVGMYSHLDEVEMTRKYRKEHDLMGLEAEDLIASSSLVKRSDVEAFMYPHDKEIEAVGVRGIYLSNYFRWDTKDQHERMIEKYGYLTKPQQRTFDCYNDVDCFHYSGIHDKIKLVKWGFGKVTDHASREIRFGRMTREQGIDLVERFQDQEPTDEPLLLEWLGMNREELWQQVERFRNLNAWHRVDGKWKLIDPVSAHRTDAGVEGNRLPQKGACQFLTNEGSFLRGDSYTLVGKGWSESQETCSVPKGVQ